MVKAWLSTIKLEETEISQGLVRETMGSLLDVPTLKIIEPFTDMSSTAKDYRTYRLIEQ